MKLVFKEYLASLNERDELDAVLPDILSEHGFSVISKPKRGTRQYGVDLMATGTDEKLGKCLYLFTIKGGDITRSEWLKPLQGLLASLNEILTGFIPSHIPPEHKDLPVKIIICCGGDIHEDVRLHIAGFGKTHTQPGQIELEEWNGDKLAEMIATGIMREKAFPANMQTLLRKSVALVDEPTASERYFAHLLHELSSSRPEKIKHKELVRLCRQILIATWTVFTWSRDIENLEAAYRISRLSMLHIWQLTKHGFAAKGKGLELATLADQSIHLHRVIARLYIEKHVAPYVLVENGLAHQIPSKASVDICTTIFEVLGRVAMNGLWVLYQRLQLSDKLDDEKLKSLDDDIKFHFETIAGLINNHQILAEPIRDDHAIEIALAAKFLFQVEAYELLADWIGEIVSSSVFAYDFNLAYPCIFRDYMQLAKHPKDGSKEYKEKATAGSVLYPTLLIIISMMQDNNAFNEIVKFKEEQQPHSAWQLWFPGDDTEELIYVSGQPNGVSFDELNYSSCAAYLEAIQKEVKSGTELAELSSVKHGQLCLLMTACLMHRLPMPPHIWYSW